MAVPHSQAVDGLVDKAGHLRRQLSLGQLIQNKEVYPEMV